MPRVFTVPAFVAAMLVALVGCSFSPTRDSTQIAPTDQVFPDTWRRVDKDIVAASIAAKGEAGAYARTTMEEWINKVRQRTEEGFIPWYSGYWTQQWLALKVARYQSHSSDGAATAAEQLAAYLQQQYYARVLEPVRREIDPDKMVDQATSVYVRVLGDEIQAIPDRYHVPLNEFHKRLDEIPAIALSTVPQQTASLYQLLQADDITQMPAYRVLVAQLLSAGGGISPRPSRGKLDPLAKSVANKLVRQLAARGMATAAAAAVGPVGILVGIGITAWGAVEHSKQRPALEAQLRESLSSALDEMWTSCLENFDSGVMGAVHHISGQVDMSLLTPEIPEIEVVPAEGSARDDW
jgi:hypothetical protein